jgi:hypothetical protein
LEELSNGTGDEGRPSILEKKMYRIQIRKAVYSCPGTAE